MKDTISAVLIILLGSFGLARPAQGSSIVPLTTAEHVTASAAVFQGVVVGTDCYRDASDGLIYTRTSLRVMETFKGTLPTIVAVVHPGGAVGAKASYNGWSPRLKHGEARLMFVTRRADGRLTGVQGSASAIKLDYSAGQLSAEQRALIDKIRALTAQHGAAGEDVTDQTGFVTSDLTTGLIDRGGGIPTRFVFPDRGEPIPYVIDADNLPAGITLTQATNAVAQALAAWSAVTSLKFRFDGFESFGMAANAINSEEEKLRIQLHDNYNAINSTTTLGWGGQYTSSLLLGSAGWGAGGNVAGNEFYRSYDGFVVLERTNATLQNLANFTEVLCHEIGHAIGGMAHSSENPSEPNTTLKQATMYYAIHAGGRGATLGTYDPPIIRQVYPTNNLPPFSYDRMMSITTRNTGAINVAGINELDVRGYDREGSPLTLATNGGTGNGGFFSRSNLTIRFMPKTNYNSTPLDPASGQYYDRLYARFSDGTNASAAADIRVIAHSFDSFPITSDGIPNDWMTTYFGNPNPTAGPNRGAYQDWDGDGLTNIDEYRTGMNPTNAASAQRITAITTSNVQFQAKAYELYELHASSNLVNWYRAMNPVVPTTTNGVFADYPRTNSHLFFRVEKVP
jgi:hypothetical protein